MNSRETKPKDTVILHIGMPKTGTTSIQNSLQGFTDGITRYARLGNSNHSIPLITAFHRDPSRHPYYTMRGMTHEEVNIIAADMHEKLTAELQSEETRIVFCGEELCRLRVDEVRRMKEFMEPFCGGFRVLAYVREPIGFASSVFQQVARHGKISGLKVFTPKYRNWFEKYLDLFGRDAVEFVRFEPGELHGGSIETDFCSRIGINDVGIVRHRKNESLSCDAVALLVEWNRHGTRSSGVLAAVKPLNRLISLLRAEFPGTFRIHGDRLTGKLSDADRLWMETQGGFSLVTDNDEKSQAGVKNDADLASRAEASVPGLKRILSERSLTAADDSPSGMMDVLYQSFLEGD